MNTARAMNVTEIAPISDVRSFRMVESRLVADGTTIAVPRSAAMTSPSRRSRTMAPRDRPKTASSAELDSFLHASPEATARAPKAMESPDGLTEAMRKTLIGVSATTAAATPSPSVRRFESRLRAAVRMSDDRRASQIRTT